MSDLSKLKKLWKLEVINCGNLKRVQGLNHLGPLKTRTIEAEVMESLHIPKGVGRVLFRILHTARWLMYKKEFDTSHVEFVRDGAKWLVENIEIKLGE
ncbi:cyclase-like protein 2 isoform X2 [Syzygium oleosum]|uniref:cyclase-like protein 2 isoform X2 n=1 Tax=Syzygium oleosum TaxID=219896 RepID=UPI0024BAAD58|nr:cyclase-like protein 2 isoform X2 [Syzygium oleosum]